MSTLKIAPTTVRKVNPVDITFSGVVTSDGNYVERFIGLYRSSTMEQIATTKSDKVTGAWSITIQGTSFGKYKVVCFGEPNENDQIFVVAGG